MPTPDAAAALVTLAEQIEARALGAGRLVRHPGQQRLCGGDAHHDVWCGDCALMEDGMLLAAQMARTAAGPVPVQGPAAG